MQIFGQIGAILIELSMIPYVWSIWKGETKPQRTTYFIWAMLGFIQIFSNLDLKNMDTIVVSFLVAINPFIIFLLSIKRGMPGFSKLDVFCLFGASIGFIFLFILKEPLISIIITAITDFVGSLPLIRKCFFYPNTEHLNAWLIYLMGAVLNIFAINSYSFVNTLYPSYLILEGLLVTSSIIIGRSRISGRIGGC